MNDIVDFYQQQAQARLSTIPWLAQMQTNALTELGRKGFPTRRDEEWKYTLVDALLKQSFTLASYEQDQLKSKDSNIPLAQQVQIYNGLITGIEQLAKTLPAGVLVLPLATAFVQHPELIKSYLGTIIHQEHGFHAMNTAMIHCGVFIYIPEGVIVDEPIVLSHMQDQSNQSVYLRHVIIAEANSQVTVLEDYHGEAEVSYLTNTVTEISVAANAKLIHYKIQRESKAAFHLGHLAVKQAASSEFESHSFSVGGKLVRSDLSVNFDEEHAKCLMNGLYATAEGQHVDHHTTVYHNVPNCFSDQDYKGILTGRSRAVFNGKVIVAKDAQHTNAKQQNKNLLLSNQAEIDTKPQLEIFANDVLCSHGATVGQLDEEALFYLATRGIDKAEASQYLIQAFAINNLRLIRHPAVAQWVGHLVLNQVEAV